MYIKGTVTVKSDDNSSFEQDLIYVITDIRPSKDGKPGSEEADEEKMKVTLMSPDGKVAVITMGIENDERKAYANIIAEGEFDGFVIAG